VVVEQVQAMVEVLREVWETLLIQLLTKETLVEPELEVLLYLLAVVAVERLLLELQEHIQYLDQEDREELVLQ
jgi:hypothetical protein